MTEKTHEKYMRAAIEEAHQAEILGEVPIGAVVVHDGQIIGRGHNMREKFQDVTYHAEILAIMEACTNLGSWRTATSTSPWNRASCAAGPSSMPGSKMSTTVLRTPRPGPWTAFITY